MILSETIFIDGLSLGRIIYDTDLRQARLEPRHDKLRSLASLEWHCPIECRNTVLAYAREAGLGSAS